MSNSATYTMILTKPGTVRSSAYTFTGRGRDHANRVANAILRAYARRLGVSFRSVEWEVKKAA
jgi:hypothetical protein